MYSALLYVKNNASTVTTEIQKNTMYVGNNNHPHSSLLILTQMRYTVLSSHS